MYLSDGTKVEETQRLAKLGFGVPYLNTFFLKGTIMKSKFILFLPVYSPGKTDDCIKRHPSPKLFITPKPRGLNSAPKPLNPSSGAQFVDGFSLVFMFVSCFFSELISLWAMAVSRHSKLACCLVRAFVKIPSYKRKPKQYVL